MYNLHKIIIQENEEEPADFRMLFYQLSIEDVLWNDDLQYIFTSYKSYEAMVNKAVQAIRTCNRIRRTHYRILTLEYKGK